MKLLREKVLTWNTVNSACQKLSKLLLGLSLKLSKLNLPPKTCIPSSAKMTMNKKSNSNRDAIDWMELSKEATRLERDRQYLKTRETSVSKYFI